MNQARDQLTRFAFGADGVRVIVDALGEPWFVASDVCRLLGHANTSVAVSGLDGDDRNTLNIAEGNRGNPNVTIISESGLYNLIFSSRLEAAREFKRWVTKEVIPSIRRTGGYMMPKSLPEALRALADAEEAKLKLQLQIADLKPKADFLMP